MGKKFDKNTKTINEIYDFFNKEQLVIDNSYQRRKVWVAKDNIRLIETILLELLIPEIFLWSCKTDPKTGNMMRHIVDGQQRINAIIDFISDKYKLAKKHLLDETIREKYGDKIFSDLPNEIKADFWNYDLSIITIDKSCKKDDIKNIFYRLNLTNYSLNEQEKRNSISSEFGEASEQLANNEFWTTYKIFSPSDIRRMKDVEFCSNILILTREGIIDQTSQERINQIYDDLKEDYHEKEIDIKKVEEAMEMVKSLKNNNTSSFLSKNTQIYTVFSFLFDLIDNNIKMTDIIANRFKSFVVTYYNFDNKMEINFENTELSQVYESIKRYKLAASEGSNKLGNRMIRFKVIKKICLSKDENILKHIEEVNNKILESLKKKSVN